MAKTKAIDGFTPAGIPAGSVNTGWNAAVEYIAESFERRAHRNQFGACSYTTAAAIVRSYRSDPAPPDDMLKRLDDLDKRLDDLDDRLAKLTEANDATVE